MARWYSRNETRQVEAYRGEFGPLETAMHKPARAITADEYIRRIDRMLVITSAVIVALATALFIRMA